MVDNDCAKTFLSSLNWSVLKREIGDVVLVDHIEDGFLLNCMDGRVLEILLVHSFHFPKSIITDQLFSLLLGLAVVDA